MFNQFNGLPLHPLAIHATVVFVPLAALMGVLFAIPRTHAWSRLPLLLLSLGSVVSCFVSRQSGLALQSKLQLQGAPGDLINTHRHLANQLVVLMLIFAVIAVAAYVVSRTPDAHPTMMKVVSVLLVIGSLAVAYQTYRVGDVGARALWNPTGQVDYGSPAIGG
jgi:hypothetical protein